MAKEGTQSDTFARAEPVSPTELCGMDEDWRAQPPSLLFHVVAVSEAGLPVRRRGGVDVGERSLAGENGRWGLGSQGIEAKTLLSAR
jgi:hypothetical protein